MELFFCFALSHVLAWREAGGQPDHFCSWCSDLLIPVLRPPQVSIISSDFNLSSEDLEMKSHIGQMRAWPYRQECRGHGPTKKNLSYR